MTLIAVAAAMSIVAVMRFAPAPAPAERSVAGFEEVVPTGLGGGIALGTVPAPVAAAVDLPVVGARSLDALPDGIDEMDHCGGMFGAVDDSDLERVLVVPDMLTASYVGTAPDDMGFDAPRPMPAPPPPGEEGLPPDVAIEVAPAPEAPPMGQGMRWRETCTYRWQDGRWVNQGAMGGPAEDGMGGGMGTGTTCCDADGLATATTDLAPPDGATWVLQERGAYWLAYPVRAGERVPLSWRFREGGFGPRVSTTHVLFVDDDGTILDEQYLGA